MTDAEELRRLLREVARRAEAEGVTPRDYLDRELGRLDRLRRARIEAWKAERRRPPS